MSKPYYAKGWVVLNKKGRAYLMSDETPFLYKTKREAERAKRSWECLGSDRVIRVEIREMK